MMDVECGSPAIGINLCGGIHSRVGSGPYSTNSGTAGLFDKPAPPAPIQEQESLAAELLAEATP